MRHTTTRRRIRAALSKAQAACALCGEPIDYQLPSTDMGSFQADHVIPLAHGGRDDLANSQAVHKRCNLSKGAKPERSEIRRSTSLAR